MVPVIRLSMAEAADLCRRAAMSSGASEPAAKSLALATVDAEATGKSSLGFLHFLDYIDALQAGRIVGAAVPTITRPTLAIFLSDAGGGLAHLGFDNAFETIVETTRDVGVAVFSQRNAYTCGAAGYFVERLAGRGLLALAVANSPAQLVAGGARTPVYGTNPMAFAVPVGDGRPPLVIDQASSATAFVNIQEAARRADAVPEGWAVDEHGEATTDPQAALKGALLAFGGTKGANIALMVEILSASSGANWSLDAPSYLEGTASPAVGLFIVAVQPALLDENFETRLAAYLQRLQGDHDVHIPGASREQIRHEAVTRGLHIDAALFDRIERITQDRPMTKR